MAMFNGDLAVIKVGTIQVAQLTNCELTADVATFDVTTKESAGKRNIMCGDSEWRMTADVNIDFVSSNWDAADFFAANQAKTLLSIKMTNMVVGDKEFSGNAYCTNVSYAAPHADKASGTITFEGTGELSIATIA